MAIGRRDYHFRPERVEGVLRVDCIGDSMTHGAGIPYDLAFPAHLGRQLNAAFPSLLFETVNHGIESANIWNSWALLEGRWQSDACDALVFSVCNNDLRFMEWWGRTYESSGDDHLWWEGHSQLGGLLDRMDAFIDRTGIPILVFYYEIRPLPAQQIAAIDRLLGGRRFAFVNTASAFRAEFGNLPTNDLILSPSDGHPSSRVHEAAARLICDTIRQAKWFSAPMAASDMLALPQKIIDATDSMISAGYDINAALNWGQEALDAKEGGLRRAVPLDALKSLDANHESARAALRSRASAWTHMLTQPLRLPPVLAAEDKLLEQAEILDYLIHNSEEMTLAAELSRGASPLLAELSAFVLAGALTAERIEGDGAVLSADLAEAKALLGAIQKGVFFPPGLADTGCIAQRVGGELEHLRHAIAPLFSRLHGFILRLERQLEHIRRLDEDGCPADLTEAARRRIGTALALLHRQTTLIRGLERDWDGAYSPLSTLIDVTLDIANPGHAIVYEIQLEVGLRYRVPARQFLRQAQNVALSKPKEVYSFTLPLLVSGDVELRLIDHLPGRDLLAQRGVALIGITIANQRQSSSGPERIECGFKGRQPDFTFARIPGVVLA
ncbi:SGNH/GDSL hydrolase family protein [Magnetospirillum sp. SS-4]|uniref:SGNH/GDSL hydrolase family protein n=1 Tax=Magnetospirillum sp. SS-4 TaxID=2681465 RepID=UPI00137D339C|nr:SGNH/GDSL hydrolase family protein [Magnetospirillum sp. SS-4]CAA7616857.1 hypothetical protein MTBSS4_170018 [Magnetospirillum sp. SS-4]